MTIEEYCEDIARQLSSQDGRFKAELQSVVHSIDYASAITSLTRTILSTDAQRKLWIDRFGLVYCIFIVPSDLFVTPVKSLFSTDSWELDDQPGETLRGAESLWGDSFFASGPLSQGDVQVHFVGHELPKSGIPKSRKRGHNVVIVDDDFMEYL